MKQMNIIILGATGFVGSSVTRALLAQNFSVSCVVRNIEKAQNQFPGARLIVCDILDNLKAEDWFASLKGVDIVINCAGIFYHPNKKILWDLHFTAADALFKASEIMHVQKIIHLSALNIDKYKTTYAMSKKAAERSLQSLNIQSIILRPSFIYGSGAGGGMNWIQGLSAFSRLVPLPEKGNQKFQPIYIGDLTQAILNLVHSKDSDSLCLAAVSREKISLKTIIRELREWLGLKKAIYIRIPFFLIRFLALPGQFISNSILNKDAIRMLEKGNFASRNESKEFEKRTGIIPLDFHTGLHQFPAQQAHRWYAKLFCIKPFLRLSLAFLWLFSATASAFLYPTAASYQLLALAGIAREAQPLMLYLAATLNGLIGLSLLFNYKIRYNCILQVLTILFYTIIITIKLPWFWIEPYGPVIKNIPVLISIWILYALETE